MRGAPCGAPRLFPIKIKDGKMSQNLRQEGSPLPEGAPALSFSNVKFYYPESQTPAVNGVSFEVRRGEFVSVIGHNGSGKSTLARLICGLLQADEGKIRVWGIDLSDADGVREARRHTGIVFQNPDNQMVASIVEDDVAFGPENLGVEREEIGRRIEASLAAVGMSDYRHATPSRLSGGQKQRIAVAGVLAIRPDILILDESTAMLDPRGRREVIEVVGRLNREEGITVLLITHFMEEALLADRTIVMNRGEIVMQGTPEDIFHSGESLVTYNLCLPEITSMADALRERGVDTRPCLRPEELAADIAACAAKTGRQGAVSPRISPDKGPKHGAWDIDIKDLAFTYSAKSPFASKALRGVDLHIGEGEFFGVIGHTGSGKSTLIQHLNALIKLPQANKKYRPPKLKKGQTPPVMPELRVGPYDLADKKCNFLQLRSDVGMVFQYPEYQLFAETVAEDVAFGLRNFNKDLSPEEVEKRVRAAISAVGLDPDEVCDKSPFDLSGGQKRRVAIAGVIVSRPKILVLDEPAAGLDPLGKKEIMELLHALHSEWCRTVVIVSHDMDEIACNCTRACVVSDGRIAMCARPHELFARTEELRSLGLDVPLTAKVCEELKKYGVDIDCDYTPQGFVAAVSAALGGERDA